MKQYYRIIFLFSFALFFAGASLAQTDAKRDKIDALRTAFINKKVNFTTREAEAFWPLYNEMNDKLDAARKTFRLRYNSQTNYNFETDKEADDYLNAELTLKQKETEINKDYIERFKRILPVKKVAAYRRAEEDFKKELIRTIKDN